MIFEKKANKCNATKTKQYCSVSAWYCCWVKVPELEIQSSVFVCVSVCPREKDRERETCISYMKFRDSSILRLLVNYLDFWKGYDGLES